MPVTIDQRDLQRRHPLCPSCGYDLVATLAANRRICPECGEGFELADLNYQRRAGDWSNVVALRRAAMALGSRFLLALAFAIAFSALAIWAINSQLPRPLPFIIALVQVCAVGTACSRKLLEQAGFESVLLIIGACIVAITSSALGYLAAAEWIIPPRFVGMAYLHLSVVFLGACAWIVHHLVMEAQ